MSRQTLEAMLIRHEGMRLRMYQCPAGKWTIGCGRNLEDSGISEEEALYMLSNDIDRAETQCASYFPWYKALSEKRQEVITSMVFNLGLKGFMEFKRMTSALALGQFDTAASEMLASSWSGQVGKRAVELADMMRVG